MNKTLVAYFSTGGNTLRAATIIADELKSDIYEIRPEKIYTVEDLNWMNPGSRSSIEMKNRFLRPVIIKDNLDINQYETVFLGFPIWWYVAPTIINTFLESYSFKGKKIILFATSGGNGFGNTLSELKTSVPDSEMIEGKVLNNMSKDEIALWARELI